MNGTNTLQTRSGTAFSPWTRNVGTPLHVPDFDFEECLQKALVASQAAGAAPSASDQTPSRGPSSSSPSSTSPPSYQSPDDPDDPAVGPTTLPSDCERLRDIAEIESLFKAFARTSEPKRTSDMFSATSSLRATSSAPDSEAQALPGGSLPDSPTTCTPSKTKKKFHADQRSKAHRRKRRGGESAKVSLLYPDGKPPKPCALRQIQNALALYADWDYPTVFAEDDTAVDADRAEVIQTDWDMDEDDIPVSSTAYTARFVKQTDADRRNITVEEAKRLPGFRYIPWTGR